MGTYFLALVRQCLASITDLPEVANIARTKAWTIQAELKEENGTLYNAEVCWSINRTETKEKGFVLMAITVSTCHNTQHWYFRGIHGDDGDYVVFVGRAPHDLPYPWYEGCRIGHEGASDPSCTLCGTKSGTVQQAYWGGTVLEEVARCFVCQELPCSTMGTTAPMSPFIPDPVPSH